MYYITFIIVLSLTVSPLFAINFKNSNTSALLLEIGENMLNPIMDIPDLTLLLRSQYIHEDTNNIYTRWFLIGNRICPLTISTYDDLNVNVGSAFVFQNMSDNRDNFAITVNMRNLRNVARYFVQRAGTFFFILTDAVDYNELLEILQTMWTKNNVYKNYILSIDGILIYDPFAYDIKERKYGKVIEYTGKYNLERTLFSNMRGYPLRIQIFRSVYSQPILDPVSGKVINVEGVDGEMVKVLSDNMNFTMDFQDPDPDYFGERDENGTYNGAISSIINNEIDACMTGFFVKDYMVPEMVFTVALYDDQLCIYVPKAKRIPQSILPVFSVGYDMWLGFLLTAFGCATIWGFMRCINLRLTREDMVKLRLQKKITHQLIRIYIDTWVVWVRVNINRFPPFYSERIFIASLCLVSVIFGAIFESSLATVYIHPMYYKDIYSMQELDNSGLKIVYKYSSMADDLFFSDTSPLFASLNKKLLHVNNLNADVTLDVAQNGGKASVTRHTSLMLESLHFILSRRIWVVPECPKYYTISYVLPKDSPFEETINDLLLRSLNAGLFIKWISDRQTQTNIKLTKEQHFESTEVFKVLNIVDLQLAFYVVVFGSCLGIVSLVTEKFLRRHTFSIKSDKIEC